MYAATDRWDVSRSHRIAVRVEVWDGATKLGTVVPLSGTVTDEWRTGVRRTLSMTLAPGDDVQPGLELRVFKGLNYGSGAPELLPLGCFPLTARDLDLQPAAINISAADRGQWLQGEFLRPRPADVGLTIAEQIALLITETGQWSTVTDSTTSTAQVQAQVWQGDRLQAIADLASSIGAEVFTDRTGLAVIRDRPAVSTPAVVLATGDAGTILNVTESLDVSRAFNAVIVAGADGSFDPQVARITERTHPAYPRRGVPVRSYRVTGPQYTTAVQAKAAAQKKLSALSSPARMYRVSALADARLDASDTVSLPWQGSTVVQQIDSVTHPLTAQDPQTITTVTGRDDD